MYGIDIGCPVRWAARALAFPQHLAQRVHHLVVGIVQRVTTAGQQLHRLADAAGLVDAALLTHRQVHRQVQEWVGARRVFGIHTGHGSVGVGQLGVVFGVFVDPLACYYFNSFKRLPRLRLGVNRAKESADIGLAWTEHGG